MLKVNNTAAYMIAEDADGNAVLRIIATGQDIATISQEDGTMFATDSQGARVMVDEVMRPIWYIPNYGEF